MNEPVDLDFGTLSVTCYAGGVFSGNGSYFAYWTGGPHISISKELMENAPTPDGPFQRDGDVVTICQYRMKIIARTERGDYIVERIEP